MNIWKITLRNIKSKPLYTVLSVFMLALSIALLLAIQQLKSSFEYQLENNLGDIDLVIGAKGSPLQLVLSSVLHLDNPTGNIPYKDALALGKNPLIKKAVPLSYGDNYKGYRIVGTTPEFTSFYKAELKEGKTVKNNLEVLLGHLVAERLQLNIGDTFQSSHGLIDNDIDVHKDEFLVVGILKPTQKVIDRLIICNLESIWDVHDHNHGDDDRKDEEHNKENEDQSQEEEHDGHEHEHDGHDHYHEGEHDHDHDNQQKSPNDHPEHKEHEDHHEHEIDYADKDITSLLISFRNPAALLTLPRKINQDTNMQAALPKFELNRLYEFTGVGLKTMSWIAYIILVISGLIIFISLYKMIKERAFDLALLRTYGASNLQLIKMVSYEGIILICLAFIVGLLFTKFGLSALSDVLDTGHQQMILRPLPLDHVIQIAGLVFVIIGLAIAIAIYPIIKMNVSTILSNEK